MRTAAYPATVVFLSTLMIYPSIIASTTASMASLAVIGASKAAKSILPMRTTRP
jgi:hypothetical protein